jgi:PAS domain S-box-containing protein
MALIYYGLLTACASTLGISCSPHTLWKFYLILTQAVSVTMIGAWYHILDLKQKVYILLNASIFWFLILVGFIIPESVLFGENTYFRQVVFSYGDEMRMIETGWTLWRLILDFTILVFVISTLLLLMKKINSISFRALVIYFSGLGIVILAALWDQLVDMGQIQSTYILPFAFFLLFIITIFIPIVNFINETIYQRNIIEQEKKWRDLINEAEVIVVGLNRMGHVEFVNPYFCKLTGFEKDEIIGKDWFEFFIPPTDYFNVQGAFVEILAYEFHPTYVNPILTKYESQKMIRWFNVRTRDASGIITGSLSIGVDVSEEKKEKEILQKKLKEAENLIHKLNEKTHNT